MREILPGLLWIIQTWHDSDDASRGDCSCEDKVGSNAGDSRDGDTDMNVNTDTCGNTTDTSCRVLVGTVTTALVQVVVAW